MVKRSLSLIANFVDGYADGWYFAVGDWFREQLDIRLTERVERVIIDGRVQYEVIEKDGKKIRKALTKKVLKWTQGDVYCFERGHVIYDSRLAINTVWKEALQHINRACFVTAAIPDNRDDKNHFISGSVNFDLFKPDEHKKTFLLTGQHQLSQHDFVKFLKSGEITKGYFKEVI